MRRFARALVLLPLVTAMSASCSKKDEAQLAPASTALAESKTDSPLAWHYVIDPKSTTHVDMPGVNEHIKGDTTAAAGRLDIAPTDISKSRGLVRIDLATFATRTFGNGDDATQTKHALTWLEVTVGDKMSDEMRWAEFAIRAIDTVSAPDVTKVEPRKDGPDDVRAVTMAVHGDVLIHGHRVEKDAVVEASFRYPPGAAPDSPPTKVQIRTTQPMRVILKELDVKPRDPAGQLLDWTTKLISKVAETADVTVDLTATPAPAAAMKN